MYRHELPAWCSLYVVDVRKWCREHHVRGDGVWVIAGAGKQCREVALFSR